MDVARLVLDYFDVLKWPLVILASVVLFRAQVAAMLKRITEVGGPAGFSAKFGEQVEGLIREQQPTAPGTTHMKARPTQHFVYNGDYDALLEAATAYLGGEVVELHLADRDAAMNGVMYVLGVARGTGGRIAFDEERPSNLYLLPRAVWDPAQPKG